MIEHRTHILIKRGSTVYNRASRSTAGCLLTGLMGVPALAAPVCLQKCFCTYQTVTECQNLTAFILFVLWLFALACEMER